MNCVYQKKKFRKCYNVEQQYTGEDLEALVAPTIFILISLKLNDILALKGVIFLVMHCKGVYHSPQCFQVELQSRNFKFLHNFTKKKQTCRENFTFTINFFLQRNCGEKYSFSFHSRVCVEVFIILLFIFLNKTLKNVLCKRIRNS